MPHPCQGVPWLKLCCHCNAAAQVRGEQRKRLKESLAKQPDMFPNGKPLLMRSLAAMLMSPDQLDTQNISGVVLTHTVHTVVHELKR